MSREWKAGDVASFEIAGQRVTAIRTSEGKWTAYAPGTARSWLDREWDGRHGQRPLVVIDPADREQVVDLVTRYCDSYGGAYDPEGQHREATDAMQAALREFADPAPPKPDEPTGLGAVSPTRRSADPTARSVRPDGSNARSHLARRAQHAVAFDADLRSASVKTGAGATYLHRSLLPLADAPIDKVSRREHREGQGDIFDLIEQGDPDGCSPYGCRSGEAVVA